MPLFSAESCCDDEPFIFFVDFDRFVLLRGLISKFDVDIQRISLLIRQVFKHYHEIP